MGDYDREWTGRGAGWYGEGRGWDGGYRTGSGAERAPWYARGLERAYRPYPWMGAPRRRHRGGAPERRRRGREYESGAARRYGQAPEAGAERRGEARYVCEYELMPDRGYEREYDRRRARRGYWRRWRTIPASEVPGGGRARERWWHAIGPERREDYDWAFSAGVPERYGWTGETGRDGGPHGRRGWDRRRRHRRAGERVRRRRGPGG